MGYDDGRHDFDFFFGAWQIANRKRVNPLVPGDDEWIEFEAHCEARPILGGLGNVDTYSAPDFPGRPGFEGFTLRLFEPKTGLWRIWWASTIGRRRARRAGRRPLRGRRRRPLRVRRHPRGRSTSACATTGRSSTTTRSRWEQSFSFDGRRTWESNWMMESTRTADYVGGLALDRQLVVA